MVMTAASGARDSRPSAWMPEATEGRRHLDHEAQHNALAQVGYTDPLDPPVPDAWILPLRWPRIERKAERAVSQERLLPCAHSQPPEDHFVAPRAVPEGARRAGRGDEDGADGIASRTPFARRREVRRQRLRGAALGRHRALLANHHGLLPLVRADCAPGVRPSVLPRDMT